MSEPKDEARQTGTEREIPPGEAQHPETLYDRSDLSARGIVFFLIALAFTILFIHLVTWGFVRYFAQQQVTPVPRNAAIVTPASQTGKQGDPALRFPAPQLQPDPVADLNKFRAALEQQLNSSGVNPATGTAHIPIDQAIDLVAQSGLPVRQPPVLPPHATFGSGDGTPAGAAGGTEPKGNR